MRHWYWVAAFSLLLLSCSGHPVSEEEAAYLQRTEGFVRQGVFPVAQEILGSDGYLLRFEAGSVWDSKDSTLIRVKSLSGGWMSFYAGDSGKALTFCPQSFRTVGEEGELKRIFIITSPEDSIAEIVFSLHEREVPVYIKADPVNPVDPQSGSQGMLPPSGGGSFHVQDSVK